MPKEFGRAGPERGERRPRRGADHRPTRRAPCGRHEGRGVSGRAVPEPPLGRLLAARASSGERAPHRPARREAPAACPPAGSPGLRGHIGATAATGAHRRRRPDRAQSAPPRRKGHDGCMTLGLSIASSRRRMLPQLPSSSSRASRQPRLRFAIDVALCDLRGTRPSWVSASSRATAAYRASWSVSAPASDSAPRAAAAAAAFVRRVAGGHLGVLDIGPLIGGGISARPRRPGSRRGARAATYRFSQYSEHRVVTVARVGRDRRACRVGCRRGGRARAGPRHRRGRLARPAIS